MSSCYEKTELFHTPEDGDAQFVQLVFGDQSIVMDKLDGNGDPANYVTSIDVKVLGPAPTSDLTVDYDILFTGLPDGLIPATAAMIDLSAASFTVPAGSSSGSIDLTFVNLEIPLEEAVSFKIMLEDGTVPAYTVSNEAIYTIFKQDYCPFVAADLVGDYNGTGSAHANIVTIALEGTDQLRIFELGEFIQSAWGENWTDGDGSCVVDIAPDGIITIPAQWIGDTDYPDVYGIEGSGVFTTCTGAIELNYQIYYGWDGSAGTLAADETTILTMIKKGNNPSNKVEKFTSKKYE